MRIHLNIGSNLGDREANVRCAVELLKKKFPMLRVSTPMETPAWGFCSENNFINVGIMIETDENLRVEDILTITQDIEKQISAASHRDSKGHYIDRLIDIDIIAVGRLKIVSPELVLPHPRAHLRDFVLIPLRELDPETAIWLEELSTK